MNPFGANGLYASYGGGRVGYYVFDASGNTAITKYPGYGSSLYTAYDYENWGLQGQASPYGLGGQWGYRTDETGLTLCGHRYYDTVTGRFLTRDPMGYAGGINLYAYCKNNPVNLMDPSGFCPDSQPGDDDWNYEQDMERFRHHVPELFATATLWGAKQMVNIGLMGVDGAVGDATGVGGEGGFGGGDGFGDGGGDGYGEGPSNIQKNMEQGQQFEEQVQNSLQNTQNDVESQVSIRPYTDNGDPADFRVRPDFIGRDSDGNLVITEAKSSPTAPLTPNQSAGYPMIGRNGGVVVGRPNAPLYPGGTVIPPTPVTIVRP